VPIRAFSFGQLLSTATLLLVSQTALLVAAPPATPKVVTSTDPVLRMKAFEQHQALLQTSPYKDLQWRWIGPKNLSGRIAAVAVVAPRGKSYAIYAASAGGGLWKTENEATSWKAVFEHGPSTAFGDVALAPSNPDIVWAGTGEANIYRSSQAGIGVYKSVDAGKTWQHMGLADTATIGRIVIHPTNPEIVYVAASGHEWTPNNERGVYKTIDGGKTWTRTLFVSEKAGAIDLVMDPKEPETLYAAIWERMRLKWNDPRSTSATTGSGLQRSTDGGKTWTPINDGLPAPQHRGRIGIDLCLSQPGTLYALVDNYEIAREPTEEEKKDPYGLPSCGFIKGATVYRSDDKGAHWKQVSGLTKEQKEYMEKHSGTYGWVFGQVRVDPSDPETVYTMGLGLNVSTDGGRTFKGLRVGGSDHHDLWIDPANSNYLVSAFDQGFAISYDKGTTWRSAKQSLPVTQFFNLSYDMATPFRVYGSVQDQGSYRGTVDLSRGREKVAAVDFESAPGGEGSTHAIDPENPNRIHSSGFYGSLSRSDLTKPRNERSKDLLPERYPDEAPLRGEWLAPTILSPHNSAIVYHGMQHLLMSRDKGDTWELISPDLTRGIATDKGDISYHTLTTISESPLRFGLIYAGTDDGRAHVTRDGGKTWTEIVKGAAPGKYISRLVASSFDLGTVYMTQNGKRDDDFTAYVWRSADYGKTWQNISSGIPGGPVNVLREDPKDSKLLYVGTDSGVYVSKDTGKTWTTLGNSLPNTYVHDLIVHPRDNVMVIATHGRGMWMLDLDKVNKKTEVAPVATISSGILEGANLIVGAQELKASVPSQAGCTYAWTITGGAITGGAATPAVTFTADKIGALSLAVSVTNKAGASVVGVWARPVVAAPSKAAGGTE